MPNLFQLEPETKASIAAIATIVGGAVLITVITLIGGWRLLISTVGVVIVIGTVGLILFVIYMVLEDFFTRRFKKK